MFAFADFEGNAFDAKRFATELPVGSGLMTPQRAYRSPIWYTPQTDGAMAVRPPGILR